MTKNLKDLLFLHSQALKEVEKKNIPEDIQLHYNIKLLGKPFTEFDSMGTIYHGMVYEGVKYYEK